eukprot:TRINITY_DN4825_c0_g1_i3.p2 TRINITY_DN4825_c0_g1~~TRINITY_DN4825_c0_g1_i3.p2  ORF type:complete len:395 (+),score=53.07 TRINITY_DN4825_c0_g1_i3:105-1289(+)
MSVGTSSRSAGVSSGVLSNAVGHGTTLEHLGSALSLPNTPSCGPMNAPPPTRPRSLSDVTPMARSLDRMNEEAGGGASGASWGGAEARRPLTRQHSGPPGVAHVESIAEDTAASLRSPATSSPRCVLPASTESGVPSPVAPAPPACGAAGAPPPQPLGQGVAPCDWPGWQDTRQRNATEPPAAGVPWTPNMPDPDWVNPGLHRQRSWTLPDGCRGGGAGAADAPPPPGPVANGHLAPPPAGTLIHADPHGAPLPTAAPLTQPSPTGQYPEQAFGGYPHSPAGFSHDCGPPQLGHAHSPGGPSSLANSPTQHSPPFAGSYSPTQAAPIGTAPFAQPMLPATVSSQVHAPPPPPLAQQQQQQQHRPQQPPQGPSGVDPRVARLIAMGLLSPAVGQT